MWKRVFFSTFLQNLSSLLRLPRITVPTPPSLPSWTPWIFTCWSLPTLMAMFSPTPMYVTGTPQIMLFMCRIYRVDTRKKSKMLVMQKQVELCLLSINTVSSEREKEMMIHTEWRFVKHRIGCGARPALWTLAMRAVESIQTGTGTQALVVSIIKTECNFVNYLPGK